MDSRRLRWGVALVLAAGFIVPLALTQEIGYWRSDAWVSHLVWDEGQATPGQDRPPARADARLVTSQLVAGAALATAWLAGVLAWRGKRQDKQP